MSQSIEVGSVLGGRYRITDHVVTSADQDLVFTGLDQVLNRRVTVLVASLENATQVASSARELATGERQDDVQVLDLGLSEGHTYLIAGGNPDPDVLLGLAYPQETYVEPFQTDTLGSEIFGSSRDAQAHEYDDDEAYYTELDEHIRADQEQHSRRPGFLNRLSDRLSERMNSSSDGSAARKAAGASALAAAGSAAKAKEDEKRRAEEAERQRLEEEKRRRAEEAERQRLEEERRRAEEAERARQEEERRRAEEAERQRVEREREEAERAERERREAEELERRRARQIEEDERRERAAAERRAAERAEREEREARQAEERAEMEQREADRRREAAVKAAAQESGKGRDGRTEQGRRAAADISTDPMPTVPAAGRGDDGSASDSARPRPAKAHRDEAAPKDDEATPKDTERQSPRRVRPAPRRALAAAAASGAGATAAGDAPRNADKANDVRRDGASSNGDGRDAGHGSEREPRADGRDASDEGRKDRSGRRGAAAAGVGAAAVGATAAAHPDGPRDRRDPDDDRRSKTGGAGWLVALLLVLLLAVALIAGFFLLNQNRDSVPDDNQATGSPTESTQPTDDGASPSEETSASPSEDVAPAEPASLVDIYREVPDAPTLESEHDDQLPNIIDGDPETYWQSYSYKRPNFGGYTRSMNFVIELEEARDIEKVTVESLASSAGQLAIGIASEDGLGDLRRGGEGTFVDGKAEVDITDDQGNAKYVVVTVTELPQLAVDNTQYAYGMRLSEITVE